MIQIIIEVILQNEKFLRIIRFNITNTNMIIQSHNVKKLDFESQRMHLVPNSEIKDDYDSSRDSIDIILLTIHSNWIWITFENADVDNNASQDHNLKLGHLIFGNKAKEEKFSKFWRRIVFERFGSVICGKYLLIFGGVLKWHSSWRFHCIYVFDFQSMKWYLSSQVKLILI